MMNDNIVLNFAKSNVDCEYTLEAPHYGGSKEYPHYILEKY